MEPNEMLLEHYLALFNNNCTSSDIESNHIEADEILCDLLEDLGYQNLVNEFKKLKKWYA
jgi:hypothetical protein